MVWWTENANSQGLEETFFTSCVLVSYEGNAGPISGSGFILFQESTNGVRVQIPGMEPKTGRFFLVTNKHLIPAEGNHKLLKIRVPIRKSGRKEIKEISVDIFDTNAKYRDFVRLHPDDDTDVAIIEMTETASEQHFYVGLLSSDLLVTKEQLRSGQLRTGDEIYIIGYPHAIFDPRNESPVLRVGIISTDPLGGWAFNEELKTVHGLPDKIDGFLIDAHVYAGSSGSMVVLRPQPNYQRGGLSLGGLKATPYILGIVSGSIPIRELGSVQRMGLGIVYSSDTIRAVLDLFQ